MVHAYNPSILWDWRRIANLEVAWTTQLNHVLKCGQTNKKTNQGEQAYGSETEQHPSKYKPLGLIPCTETTTIIIKNNFWISWPVVPGIEQHLNQKRNEEYMLSWCGWASSNLSKTLVEQRMQERQPAFFSDLWHPSSGPQSFRP